jgi:hypothetical protein
MRLTTITRYRQELGKLSGDNGFQDRYCLRTRWGSLEKGIDPELVLPQGQVSRLKESDVDRVPKVREWLQSRLPGITIQPGLGGRSRLIKNPLGPATEVAKWPEFVCSGLFFPCFLRRPKTRRSFSQDPKSNSWSCASVLSPVVLTWVSLQSLSAAEAVLKQHPQYARDVSIARLHQKLETVIMGNELLYQNIKRRGDGRPFLWRRSRR